MTEYSSKQSAPFLAAHVGQGDRSWRLLLLRWSVDRDLRDLLDGDNLLLALLLAARLLLDNLLILLQCLPLSTRELLLLLVDGVLR